MRKPWPIREPLSSGKPEVFSQPWAQSFTEMHAYYNEVLRWMDPGRADFGKTEPPAAYRRTGLIAYADGVNWNPGEGAGEYWWNGSAWKKIPRIGETATTPLDASWIPKPFESTEQTITSAGALTLAHGLGTEPKLIQVWLVCKTAEAGYSAGDKLPVAVTHIWWAGAYYQAGCSIVPDTTNLNIRFGLSELGTIWGIPNKSTGASFSITNTNWKAIFRAWA